jgi:hypothetical protein
MFRGINEGGFACVDIDMMDLVWWLHRLSPTRVIADEVASAIAILASSKRTR